MNIGIISTSKRINFQNLPNNTYLIFYVSKTKKNKNQLQKHKIILTITKIFIQKIRSTE